MKKKILILGLLLIGLLFYGYSAFALVQTYERTPAGDIIQNPVEMEIYYQMDLDYFNLMGCNVGDKAWLLFLIDEEENMASSSDWIMYPTLELNWTLLPLSAGTYDGVGLYCAYSTTTMFEYNPDGIFEVFDASPPPPPFVETPTSFVTSTLAYVGQAVSGLGPFLALIIGIPLAFWVLWKVTGLIPKDKRR